MMKKLVTVLTWVSAFNAFAYDTETFNISVPFKTLHSTEAAAVAAGVAVEARIKAGKFKSKGHENFNCEFGSDVDYATQNVEIKKLYVDGVAKYKTVVNAVMECEEEYDM